MSKKRGKQSAIASLISTESTRRIDQDSNLDHKAYIGLGSNLDDPVTQLSNAIKGIKQIKGTRLNKASPFYRSKALVSKKNDVQPDYVNAVVLVTTELSALQLLRALQAIENKQGRVRKHGEHWGARTLDLDLLLFADQTINHPDLKVPHYALEERSFVVFPLLDIAEENLQIPGSTSLARVAEKLDKKELTRITDTKR